MTRRRSRADIEAIKHELCGIWGRILVTRISTEEVYKELGFDYNNVNDREALYRYTRECREEAEALWDQFTIIKGDKEEIYKKWLDHCYLEKIPYIIFFEGVALTPKTYAEWEQIFTKRAIQKILGLQTTVERMARKEMFIGEYPAEKFLSSIDESIRLLPNFEEDKE